MTNFVIIQNVLKTPYICQVHIVNFLLLSPYNSYFIMLSYLTHVRKHPKLVTYYLAKYANDYLAKYANTLKYCGKNRFSKHKVTKSFIFYWCINKLMF